MNERVIEILIYLITELRKIDETNQDIDYLSQDLLTQGYLPKEIDFALDFLTEHKDLLSETFSFKPQSRQSNYRILHSHEKMLITPEAYGLLIQLRHSNLIDDVEIELILERAMFVGLHRIDQEDMKEIIANVIFSPESYEQNGYFYLDNSQYVH